MGLRKGAERVALSSTRELFLSDLHRSERSDATANGLCLWQRSCPSTVLRACARARSVWPCRQLGELFLSDLHRSETSDVAGKSARLTRA